MPQEYNLCHADPSDEEYLHLASIQDVSVALSSDPVDSLRPVGTYFESIDYNSMITVDGPSLSFVSVYR